MDSLEKKLYNAEGSSDSAGVPIEHGPKMSRRGFLKYVLGVGLALGGVNVSSGCIGRDERITPAPTIAPHVQFLRDNADLSYGFTRADEGWAKNYLEQYGKEWFSSHPELHETLNAKIRQERLILNEKLGQTYSGVQDIVGANWDYHYDLWKQSESLLSLDADEMTKDFPNHEDREIIYRGMWMPYTIMFVDVSTMQTSNLAKLIPDFDILKKNMENIVNGKSRERIMKAYKDPEYDDGKRKLYDKISDYNEARYFYEGTWSSFAHDSTFGFPNTGKLFGEIYDTLLQEDERLVDIERFIYGLASVDVPYEQLDVFVSPIYAKALGGALFEQRGVYPTGAKFSGYHQVVAMPVQKHVIDEIKSNPSKFGTPIIGPGQTISLYCAKEPLIADKIPYVDQVLPTGNLVRLFELQ